MENGGARGSGSGQAWAAAVPGTVPAPNRNGHMSEHEDGERLMEVVRLAEIEKRKTMKEALKEPEKENPNHTRKSLEQEISMELLHEIMRGNDEHEEATTGKKKLWVQTTQADFFFGGWICVNAVVLALETDLRTEENEEHTAWIILDSVFNVVFLFELVLRMYAERKKWVRDVWNVFDFVLVVVGVTDSWILPATGLNSDMRFVTLMRLFRLFRLIRVLRVLRLLRFLKELMLLIQGITSAMRAMVWGLLLLGITIFICALLLTRLVGKACCESDDTFQDELYFEYFGSLARTSFTLFQFTMEFQPDICRETWSYGPWLTFFFLAYTMFTNITLLNTVASVIVENILSISQANNAEQQAKLETEASRNTHDRMSQVFAMVDLDGNRMIEKSEIEKNNPAVEGLLAMSGVTMEHAMNLFNIMDVDESGAISRDEFQKALARGTHPLQASDVLRVQCQLDAMKLNMTKISEDACKQNTAIIEALDRLEAKQTTLEEKLETARQPDPRDLDDLSISFVSRPALPMLSAKPGPGTLPQDANPASPGGGGRRRPWTATLPSRSPQESLPLHWGMQDQVLLPGRLGASADAALGVPWAGSPRQLDEETLLV